MKFECSMIFLILILYSNCGKMSLKLKEIEICSTCRSMIRDIKHHKGLEACQAYGSSTDNCKEIYYYLSYFQPDYIDAEIPKDKNEELNTNCEICSNLDQCSYHECTENYYNPKKEEETEFEKMTKNSRFVSGKGTKKEKAEIELSSESEIRNELGLEFEKLTSGNIRSELSLQTDSELEKFFNSKVEDSIYEDTNDFALNFDLNKRDMHKTKINILLSRIDNRINLLKENIKTFLKINLQSSLFKKNVIKFFLFLKMKQKSKSSSVIDNKLLREKNMIERLKHSASEITKIQAKLEVLSKIVKKLMVMKESHAKNGEIKKLMISIDVIFKEINVIFKSIQSENIRTINMFKKSMFNSEMLRMWKLSVNKSVAVPTKVSVPKSPVVTKKETPEKTHPKPKVQIITKKQIPIPNPSPQVPAPDAKHFPHPKVIIKNDTQNMSRVQSPSLIGVPNKSRPMKQFVEMNKAASIGKQKASTVNLKSLPITPTSTTFPALPKRDVAKLTETPHNPDAIVSIPNKLVPNFENKAKVTLSRSKKINPNLQIISIPYKNNSKLSKTISAKKTPNINKGNHTPASPVKAHSGLKEEIAQLEFPMKSHISKKKILELSLPRVIPGSYKAVKPRYRPFKNHKRNKPTKRFSSIKKYKPIVHKKATWKKLPKRKFQKKTFKAKLLKKLLR